MAWLEAATAFAVVMMVLSTIATIILETIFRFANVRGQGLKKIIGHVRSDVISRYIPAAADPTRFSERIVQTQLPTSSGVGKLTRSGSLTELSTLGFVERLARSPEGIALFESARQRGEGYLDDVIEDIAARYEAIGDNMSQSFRRNARLYACGIGIVIAFTINFDALHLFTSLLTDPRLRVALIESGEPKAEALNSAEENLAVLLDEALEDKAKLDEILARVQENNKEILDSYEELRELGAPINGENRPWAKQGWKNKGLGEQVAAMVAWSLMIALSGVLIGLGGPFWHDAFQRLGSLLAVAKVAQSEVQAFKNAQDAGSKKTESAAGASARVFEKAVKLNSTQRYQGRKLLAADGSVLER